MKDTLGKYLLEKRIQTVLPLINGKLVDIGCGTNELSRAYGKNAIGVDVYPWEGVNIVVDDTSKLPFDSNSIDTVTIIAALNHIPNRADVLREAHRILAKDGCIILTMIPPLISTIWHTLRKPWDADQNDRGMKEGEVYGIAPQAMRHLLHTSQFKCIKEKTFMYGLNRIYIAKKV